MPDEGAELGVLLLVLLVLIVPVVLAALDAEGVAAGDDCSAPEMVGRDMDNYSVDVVMG